MVNTLAALPVKDESMGNSNSPFNTIPLSNYTGTNFPTDTTAANYALIKTAKVTNQDEVLKYSLEITDLLLARDV